jgi:hypothetical protein
MAIPPSAWLPYVVVRVESINCYLRSSLGQEPMSTPKIREEKTALMEAIRIRSPGSAAYLCTLHGTNLDIRNFEGHTAEEIAKNLKSKNFLKSQNDQPVEKEPPPLLHVKVS